MKNGNHLIKCGYQQNVDNFRILLIKNDLKISYPQSYKHLWITLYTFIAFVKTFHHFFSKKIIWIFLNSDMHLSQTLQTHFART